jgi:hypothetical protein
MMRVWLVVEHFTPNVRFAEPEACEGRLGLDIEEFEVFPRGEKL